MPTVNLFQVITFSIWLTKIIKNHVHIVTNHLQLHLPMCTIILKTKPEWRVLITVQSWWIVHFWNKTIFPFSLYLVRAFPLFLHAIVADNACIDMNVSNWSKEIAKISYDLESFVILPDINFLGKCMLFAIDVAWPTFYWLNNVVGVRRLFTSHYWPNWKIIQIYHDSRFNSLELLR